MNAVSLIKDLNNIFEKYTSGKSERGSFNATTEKGMFGETLIYHFLKDYNKDGKFVLTDAPEWMCDVIDTKTSNRIEVKYIKGNVIKTLINNINDLFVGSKKHPNFIYLFKKTGNDLKLFEYKTIEDTDFRELVKRKSNNNRKSFTFTIKELSRNPEPKDLSFQLNDFLSNRVSRIISEDLKKAILRVKQKDSPEKKKFIREIEDCFSKNGFKTPKSVKDLLLTLENTSEWKDNKSSIEKNRIPQEVKDLVRKLNGASIQSAQSFVYNFLFATEESQRRFLRNNLKLSAELRGLIDLINIIKKRYANNKDKLKEILYQETRRQKNRAFLMESELNKDKLIYITENIKCKHF